MIKLFFRFIFADLFAEAGKEDPVEVVCGFQSVDRLDHVCRTVVFRCLKHQENLH